MVVDNISSFLYLKDKSYPELVDIEQKDEGRKDNVPTNTIIAIIGLLLLLINYYSLFTMC